jgi:aminoglycoside phosphotransferase (APT) family kinase protein
VAGGGQGAEPGGIDLPGEVREEDRLDPARLAAWMGAALPALAGPLEVRQFRHGHSNLTYAVRAGERELVLRRAPRGTLARSAHDMRREFTILSALEGLYPRAPRPVAYCDDPAVAGAPFYLMERVQGVILRKDGAGSGQDAPPELWRRLSAALADGLAELHALEVGSGPLAGLGKPAGYVERQVKGWTERYLRARTDEVPEVEAAAAWLERHRPPESGAALVHNDYKYDNLVLDPEDWTRVRAVLDWEMATVGDPLLDLGTTLGYWVDPGDPEELQRLAFGPTARPGNLRRAELAERYAARSGRELEGALFPYAFGLFKIAVIVQQIYRRFREGSTTDPRFAALGAAVRVLGVQAVRAIARGRIDDLG